MREFAALMISGVVLAFASAKPLPPVVDKLAKEGIPVSEANEAKVQGELGKEGGDGVHIFKLLKGQTYGIDLAATAFKARLEILTGSGQGSPVVSDNGKANFSAPVDGTYKIGCALPR